ncbi:hypothetical protein PSPO01_15939 [Paraphaeosphaeria sporulosa]
MVSATAAPNECNIPTASSLLNGSLAGAPAIRDGISKCAGLLEEGGGLNRISICSTTKKSNYDEDDDVIDDGGARIEEVGHFVEDEDPTRIEDGARLEEIRTVELLQGFEDDTATPQVPNFELKIVANFTYGGVGNTLDRRGGYGDDAHGGSGVYIPDYDVVPQHPRSIYPPAPYSSPPPHHSPYPSAQSSSHQSARPSVHYSPCSNLPPPHTVSATGAKGADAWVFVPRCATTMRFIVRGGSGGVPSNPIYPAGLGGIVTGSLAVTPGRNVHLIAGGAGDSTGAPGTSLFGSGGESSHGGGGGGGASALLLDLSPVAVAGGGGGGANAHSTGHLKITSTGKGDAGAPGDTKTLEGNYLITGGGGPGIPGGIVIGKGKGTGQEGMNGSGHIGGDGVVVDGALSTDQYGGSGAGGGGNIGSGSGSAGRYEVAEGNDFYVLSGGGGGGLSYNPYGSISNASTIGPGSVVVAFS